MMKKEYTYEDEIAVTSFTTVLNSAHVISIEDTTDRSASAPVNVYTDVTLAINKTVTPNEVTRGSHTTVTFTITVTNTGVSTATDLVVTDDVPAALLIQDVQVPGGSILNWGGPGNQNFNVVIPSLAGSNSTAVVTVITVVAN